MNAVEFQYVDVIFGERPQTALDLLDQGESRETILAQTGQVVGVAGATLAIEQGEICVLMGLSGSGKSTLLRCVNGLNKVSRGALRVADGADAVDVTRCNAAALRRLRMNRVAMVFQQFALLPWRTVAENVGFGLELRGMNKSERTRIVQDKLALVGLSSWQDKYAHELSGGMQQRVGLARAFATDADILLMDEPFSALDPLIRARLQDELLDLQRTLQKTIVFVSHDLDEAMKLGTHIAIMDGGRIVQYGTPEDIVLNPANDYVADFVAHMNPLNVLRGASLMTPVADLACQADWLVVDAARQLLLRLDAAGQPALATLAGQPVTLPQAPADITLKTTIQLRHSSGLPVLLTADGRLVGVVGDAEIYRGMLRQDREASLPGVMPLNPPAKTG